DCLNAHRPPPPLPPSPTRRPPDLPAPPPRPRGNPRPPAEPPPLPIPEARIVEPMPVGAGSRGGPAGSRGGRSSPVLDAIPLGERSEEHTSELQSRFDLVCRLLLEK